MSVGVVYLLHFSRAYAHARHYVGWSEDVAARVAEHLSGRGSPLVRAAVLAGAEIVVARTWEADRNFERKLKNRKNAAGVCPLCLPELRRRAAERMRVRRRVT